MTIKKDVRTIINKNELNKLKELFHDKKIIRGHGYIEYIEVPAVLVTEGWFNRHFLLAVIPDNLRQIKIFDDSIEDKALEFANEFGYERIFREGD